MTKRSRYAVAVAKTGKRALKKAISDGLDSHNVAAAGPYRASEILIGVRNAKGEDVGGVLAVAYWDTLFVKWVWLAPKVRKKALGARMLAAAEDEGRRRGCKLVYLDTFSFQAPGFYEKQGYARIGALDYPGAFSRYWYAKPL